MLLSITRIGGEFGVDRKELRGPDGGMKKWIAVFSAVLAALAVAGVVVYFVALASEWTNRRNELLSAKHEVHELALRRIPGEDGLDGVQRIDEAMEAADKLDKATIAHLQSKPWPLNKDEKTLLANLEKSVEKTRIQREEGRRSRIKRFVGLANKAAERTGSEGEQALWRERLVEVLRSGEMSDNEKKLLEEVRRQLDSEKYAPLEE